MSSSPEAPRGNPYLSVVIPVFDEEDSLRPLCEKLHLVLEKQKFESEIIFVDDGSTDASYDAIVEMSAKYPRIRAVRFRRNYRKAAALATGFLEAPRPDNRHNGRRSAGRPRGKFPAYWRLSTETTTWYRAGRKTAAIP